MVATDSRSVVDLLQQATQQTATLVRDELRLARAEMAEKARDAGSGAGLLAGAGLAAFYGLAAVLVAAGLGLAYALPGWLSALVVAAVLFVVTAILAVLGRARLRRATPAAPQRTAASMKADLDTVGAAIENRRR